MSFLYLFHFFILLGLFILIFKRTNLFFSYGLRTGFGYDVHELVDGMPLVLCGVNVPHGRGLVSFSDGDVASHAVIDALLGAAVLSDIGALFPSSDFSFKNMSSLKLIDMTVQFLVKNRFRPKNVDVTIVAQEPVLQPYVSSMRLNLSGVLGIPVSMISVKATTEEGLGFTGSKKGIAAYCVANVTRLLF